MNEWLKNFRPIPKEWAPRNVKEKYPVLRLNEGDPNALADLLMGRRVIKVDDEHVVLDDGTTLRMIGHSGGCSCGAGDYDLTVLNGGDNVITKVEFENKPGGDDSHYSSRAGEEIGVYRIWVYAGNEKINLMQVNGSDGNGYYGTGYEILVRRPEEA